MPKTNNQKPANYTAAFNRVEAMAENALKERLNRGMTLLCETETIRNPRQRELAQARVLQRIADTNADLEQHQATARSSNGG